MSAIDTYIRKVKQHPHLDPDEETDLANRYAATKDRAAAQRLIESHLQLVIGFAQRYCGTSWQLSDLVQEGNIGLLKALDSFDTTRGRFHRHATFFIRRQILKYMLDNTIPMALGVPRRGRQLYCQLLVAQQGGRAVSDDQLAQLLEDSEGKGAALQALVEMSSGCDDTAREAAADAAASEEPITADVVRSRLRGLVHVFEGELTTRERDIFRARWLTDKPSLMRELGVQHRLHSSSIARIEAKVLRRLGDFLKRNQMDDELAC